ncbi:unnamed protein product [Amoebophrya sp. A120]|nr:unnamed protein product [Amoebophrya sp. A120]|eukprot:GSA120T00014350001.1
MKLRFLSVVLLSGACFHEVAGRSRCFSCFRPASPSQEDQHSRWEESYVRFLTWFKKENCDVGDTGTYHIDIPALGLEDVHNLLKAQGRRSRQRGRGVHPLHAVFTAADTYIKSNNKGELDSRPPVQDLLLLHPEMQAQNSWCVAPGFGLRSSPPDGDLLNRSGEKFIPDESSRQVIIFRASLPSESDGYYVRACPLRNWAKLLHQERNKRRPVWLLSVVRAGAGRRFQTKLTYYPQMPTSSLLVLLGVRSGPSGESEDVQTQNAARMLSTWQRLFLSQIINPNGPPPHQPVSEPGRQSSERARSQVPSAGGPRIFYSSIGSSVHKTYKIQALPGGASTAARVLGIAFAKQKVRQAYGLEPLHVVAAREKPWRTNTDVNRFVQDFLSLGPSNIQAQDARKWATAVTSYAADLSRERRVPDLVNQIDDDDDDDQ